MVSSPVGDESRLFKAGIVTLLGRPNVGKSSLINKLLEQKVSIVSPKPQTTRDSILCILNRPNLQVIFKDTPGIHIPLHKLGEHLVRSARRSVEDTDLVLYMVEGGDRDVSREDQEILSLLMSEGKPFILLINKIDRNSDWSHEDVLRIRDLYSRPVLPLEVIPISVRTSHNLDLLIQMLYSVLPPGYPYYPEDILIDRSERFLAAELIREKIFLQTHEEVPHSTAVTIEEYKSPEEYPERKDLYIRSTIYVERESQKGIIIGGKGKMLKKIGTLARVELERMTGFPVFLDLWVKVRKDWRKSEKEVNRMVGDI